MFYLLLENFPFLSLGFGAPRVNKGAAKKVEELPVKRFTSGLREGKHSGIRIGHEQQEFRSKKSAIKRLQYN